MSKKVLTEAETKRHEQLIALNFAVAERVFGWKQGDSGAGGWMFYWHIPGSADQHVYSGSGPSGPGFATSDSLIGMMLGWIESRDYLLLIDRRNTPEGRVWVVQARIDDGTKADHFNVSESLPEALCGLCLNIVDECEYDAKRETAHKGAGLGL